MTTRRDDEPIGPAWLGDWRARIAARLRDRGFRSVSDFIESRPTAPLIDLAAELSRDGEVDRRDVAAEQLARLWREEALVRGPDAVERLARRALVGELHRHLRSGWATEWKGEDISRATHVMGSWSSIVPVDVHERAFSTYQALLRDRGIPAGWLPSDLDDPVLMRAFAARWNAPTSSSEDRTIVFDEGHEFAPDAPWGAERLTITPRGRFTYERRQRGTLIQLRGRIDTAIIENIEKLLAASGFPQIPSHRLPPGASAVTLTVASPSAPPMALTFHRYFAAKLPAYAELIDVLVRLNAALRSGDAEKLRDVGLVLES